MLAYILGVALFALAICVSIALHEAGHMLTAKAFGMKVRRYFIGFGPTLFSFRRGETEYGLKAVPLGGFCDIAGMTALDEVTPEESRRAMWRYPTWKRTVVLSAGSITHFIVGFIVLYLMAAFMFLPNINRTAELASVSQCVREAETPEQLVDPTCRPGDPAPAKEAGLLPGDVIVSVDGQPMADLDQVTDVIQQREGPTPIQVNRGGDIVPLIVDVAEITRPNPDLAAVKAGKAPETVTVGMIGVTFPMRYEYGPGEAFGASVTFTGEMFDRTWHALLRFPERIPLVVEAIFGAERDENTPVSVVGASRLGGEAVELGLWWIFLMLLASLNFFVGVFNLLPLLPLDGGHIAVTWYERVRDKIRQVRGKSPAGPVDYTKLSALTMVVVLIGGAVVLLTVTADIVNPIRLVPQ
ncbi:MAG: M50 family metallopeptidase [Haloechinothrix sp.]